MKKFGRARRRKGTEGTPTFEQGHALYISTFQDCVSPIALGLEVCFHFGRLLSLLRALDLGPFFTLVLMDLLYFFGLILLSDGVCQ